MPDKNDSKALADVRSDENSFVVRVWDLPTRLFHWLLVCCVAGSLITGNMGGLTMTYHEWCGVAILAMILFRIVWGAVGGVHSRFNSFLTGPRVVLDYTRRLFGGESNRYLGHNPLGGWSIITMLASLLIQVCSGLFANDDILTEGPLAFLISNDLSDQLTYLHHANKWILISLLAVHVLAVVFYWFVKRENLVAPMVSGNKKWPEKVKDSDDKKLMAMGIFTAIAIITYLSIYSIH